MSKKAPIEVPEGSVVHKLSCSACKEVFVTVPIPADITPDSNLMCIKCLRDRDQERFGEVIGRRKSGKPRRNKFGKKVDIPTL
jgi:hypothetical protein